jgi:hypothetical protein
MSIEAAIEDYLASQPAPKSDEMRALHRVRTRAHRADEKLRRRG